jgi:Calx-beta domain/FG-GAP-like repeat
MSFDTWLQNLRSAFEASRNGRKPRRQRSKRNTSLRPQLEALEDRTTPTFFAPVGYDSGASPRALVSGYFDSGTVLDLAVVNDIDSSVSVLLGNGDGTFQPAVTSPTGPFPLSIAAGDFNGDGFMDLATANYEDMSVLMGNGDGTFDPARSYGVYGYPGSVVVGDFNGDGLLDLGVTSGGEGLGSCVSVRLGDGTGNFSGPNAVATGAGAALAADLNGDIYDDLVTFDYGYATVLLGDSSGYLQEATYYFVGDLIYGGAAGDLDGDGDIDLVTANYNGNSVSVLLGDRLGGFSGPTSYAGGSNPTSIVLGDFTHDGNLDVATSSYDSHQVSVLHGDGAGALTAPVLFATGSNPWAIAAGDFDGDTWLDAATANQGTDIVSVMINDTSWPEPAPPTVSINNVAVTEGNTGTTDATFTIRLSNVFSQDVTVHYETATGSAMAGSDYTAASGNVTIPAGQTTRTFTVAVSGDRLAEPAEYFIVNLSNPVNATIGDGQGNGYIDDDEPMIFIDHWGVTDNATVKEGNTGSVNATFTLGLSATSDVDVTVHFNTADLTAEDEYWYGPAATAGVDYPAASGTVIIPAGQTSRTFTVAVRGDRLAEPNEFFFVKLSAPVNAGIYIGQGNVSILDDEPRISISDVFKKEGKKSTTTQFIFTVTLSAPYDQAVKMSYNTANGTATTSGNDYIAKSGTLTFAPGETTKTITIEVKGDSKKETNETFYLDLFGNSSNSLFTKNRGIGTILNDD